MSITLITGASRGVGEALAWKLAGEGHTVAALARNEEALQALAEKAEAERLSGAIIPCAVDLRDPDAISQCVGALENRGPIGTLVNNAAVVENIPFAEQSIAQIEAIVDSNLKGTLYCTHAVIQHMIPRRAGKIINVSSVAGIRGISGQVSYCASKHGMVGFADALTQELIPHNIQVATICPGAIDTPLWDPERNPYPGDIKKTIQPSEIVDLISYILAQPDHSIFKRIVVFPSNEWH